MDTADIVRLGATVIAVAAIVGFTYMYGRAIYLGWKTPGQKLEHGAEYVYVATALAGLVGGVVAMVFNEDPPPSTPPSAPADPEDGQSDHEETMERATASENKRRVIHSVNPFSHETILSAMSAVYVLAYLFIGLGSVVSWIKLSSKTSDLVKNIALISIGLFLAIARTFFNLGA